MNTKNHKHLGKWNNNSHFKLQDVRVERVYSHLFFSFHLPLMFIELKGGLK